jgi:hypothetical protein
MRLTKKWYLVLAVLLIFCNMQAQVFAPAAYDSTNAQYGNDKVFVFNRPEYKADLTASIIALSPDGLNNWTFQWAVYFPQDSGYSNLSLPTTGSSSVVDTITVSSGYRVAMTNGTENHIFRVWVIINDLSVAITNKDEGDTVLFGYYNCASLDFRADSVRIPLYYYNPSTGSRVNLFNIYSIRWSADNDEATIPPGRLLTRVSDPPWMDTWYTITITDSYGMERSDSVFYKSIQSKAQIKDPIEYIKLVDDTVNYPNHDWFDTFYDYDDVSAPARFKIDISESKNLSKYLLVFGDGDSVTGSLDSLLYIHEYKKPGEYKVILTTISDPPYECLDTMSLSVIIDYATEERFNMPNVFTPSSSRNNVFTLNENNVFRTSEVSVIFVEITIFSRTGLKVHKYEGLIRDWPGWDGFIMNSGREAPEGVYFYVISRLDAYQSATDPIDKKWNKGFIHLYRR